MSATLMGASFYVPHLHPSEKNVLLALADHANDDGRSCYPGIERLTTKSGLGERQVQRVLRRLTDKNLIAPVRYAGGGRGHATEWELNVELIWFEAQSNGWGQRVTSVTPFPVKGDTGDVKGDTGDVKGDTGDVQRVTPMTPQPSVNHQEPDDSISKENPRQKGEPIGDYLARIAGLIVQSSSM